VLEVAVITAQAIDDAQIAGLVSALQEKYKQRITISVVVDATLIGGVKIVIGDKVIDATVRGKLDSMAATLTH
jgi:F-type H+-transporting ATPase subunit delta